jgi:predicted ArsR family transcriptional regulator
MSAERSGRDGDNLSSPRRRLLELLRSSPTPMDGYELGEATGLHITTVRFHLDQLLTAGLITASTQPRTTPGRPRTAYAAVPPPEGSGQASYQTLATLLATHLGGSAPVRRRRAEKVGRTWAASLIPPAELEVGRADATRHLTALLTTMSFQPEPAEPAGQTEVIRLRGCPYRDVARQHPDVVCSIHLGLLRGAFDRLGAPPTEITLSPFVEPELCTVHLAASGSPTAAITTTGS